MFHFFQWLPANYLPLIVGVSSLIQLCAAVHVLRARHPISWLWVIIFLPPVGAIVYFLVEVRPNIRYQPLSNPVTALLDWWNPRREFLRLKEELELSDTVANRKALAEHHLRHGEYAQGIDLYRTCLRGPFKDDAGVHLDLARAHFHAGQYDEAKHLLERLRQISPTYEAQKRDFFLARSFEEMGNKEDALTMFEKVTTGPMHEEARVRQALLLEEQGQKQKARTIYADVVRRMKKAAHHYRRDQREWWLTAQERLKELSRE